MNLLDRIHGGYVYSRRVRVLSNQLSELIPPGAQVLDVGSGDGLLAQRINQRRPDIAVQGLDVLVRSHTHIPVATFDGRVFPSDKMSFDVVMLVDVLHHTEDPMILLREATRVSRRAILIKDHTLEGLLAGPRLRLLDWVGNARHGVALPYNFWSRRRWFEAFQALDLKVGLWKQNLNLYPWPADVIFGRSLQFVARLELREAERGERRAGSATSQLYPIEAINEQAKRRS